MKNPEIFASPTFLENLEATDYSNGAVGVSQTIPGQAEGLSTIVDRYLRGR